MIEAPHKKGVKICSTRGNYSSFDPIIDFKNPEIRWLMQNRRTEVALALSFGVA